jgi:outer membrane protein assembly factor BamB
MRHTLVVLFMIAAAAGAKTRAVRHPAPPEVIATYRGNAERNGVLQGTGPRTFTHIAWQTAVAVSFNAPVYANGKVFVPTNDGRITTLSAVTGEILWRSQRLGAFSSPVTVAGDVVYVSGEDKHIYALSAATGATLWSFVEDDWSVGAPLLSNGTLYFGTEAGTLYAIDAATRAEKWRFAAGGHIHCHVVFSDGLVYFAAEKVIIALSASDGREVWRMTRDANWYAVAVSGGVMLATASDGFVFAYDARIGAERWHVAPPAGVLYWTPVALLNGVAYTTNDINRVVALDLLTGTTRWTYTASDMASEVVIADGVIYVGTFGAHQPNDDNALKDVVALDAATGHELFKTRVTGHNYTGVAVGDGTLFVMTSRGFVYALQ